MILLFFIYIFFFYYSTVNKTKEVSSNNFIVLYTIKFFEKGNLSKNLKEILF